MPRERYPSYKEQSRRIDLKQRKALSNDVTGLTLKVHDLHASSGLQGFISSLDLGREPRLHKPSLPDRKFETLYPDTGLNAGEKFGSSMLPSQALCNGLAEQVFDLPNFQAAQLASTLGYPYGNTRVPPAALTLPTPGAHDLAGHPSLKTVDPLLLSRILLDQQVVAMAQMQQLHLLQQSYFASGGPLYLVPENLMSADFETLWHLKHPGLPLPPNWITLPWFQEDAGSGTDLQLKEADLRSKDIRRYQEHLRYNKLEKPRAGHGTPLEGVDQTRFLREGTEASDITQTATDFIRSSACSSKDKKYRERKTFMGKEKQGFSTERETRDRNWGKMEPKSGISEHPHQQSWLDAVSKESSTQLQTNFVMPGFRQSDRKPERRRDESGCMSDYPKYEWPDCRASLNEERTRKPSENAACDQLQMRFTRPSSNPNFGNSDALHPRNTGYAISDQNQDFCITPDKVKDGQPLPPDWFSSREPAKHHGRKVSQSPGGVYKSRTNALYQHSQEIVHRSPTVPEAMLQCGSVEVKALSSVKQSRQSLNQHNRHTNDTANGASLESWNGVDPAACGFTSSQNGARDLLIRQNSQPTTLSRFSASEAQKVGTQENWDIHHEWERNELSRKRFYHKVPNDIPSGFPYSVAAGMFGRYSTFPGGLSTSSVGYTVSSALNSHHVSSHHPLGPRSHMPSLSPICSNEHLQNRRASRWTEGIDASKTKKLKLDLSRSVDSPLPSWMNMSTFSGLSTSSIDSFKSFVDHTVQTAFMNEMKEAENCSAAAVNKTKLRTEASLEEHSVGHSAASVRCSSENIPGSNSSILAVSSMESLSSHTSSLSTKTSGATPSTSRCSTLPTVESIPCRLETPLSAGPDFGYLSQTSEAGVHTKFKKTWLLNYLDEDRKLSSDSSVEYHQNSEAELVSPKDNDDQFNGRDEENNELHVNGNCCTNGSPLVELNDLSASKKLDQA